MPGFFDPSQWSRSMPADPRERVVALEEAIEELADYAARCRKAMQMSRAAIVVGALLFVGAFLGLAGYNGTIAAVGGFAAMIGGFVWLGANKSSDEQARAALARAQADLASAIDELGLQRLN